MSSVNEFGPVSEVPSLDDQNGNMPGAMAFDAGYEEWIDQQGLDMPPTPQEEEIAYQEWLKQEEMRAAVIAAQQPKRRDQYHMVALKGKDKGFFEIRRDRDGQWVQVIKGRAEAKRELDKMNAA